MISRNEPMGTVERARKNLVYMRNARKAGADIHEVTHLLHSLLALIVVPWERLQDCGVSRLKPVVSTCQSPPTLRIICYEGFAVG